MQDISFENLPKAVQILLEQVEILHEKIDNIPMAQAPKLDEERYVDILEIRQLVFPHWKKQTIYNKCSMGELPHSRVGGRLLFNLKECKEWRDEQFQQGKIKSISQIDEEAQAFYNKKSAWA